MSDTVFISYAKNDRSMAMEIHDILQRFGLSPWVDVVQLRPGQDWRLEIKKAIESSAIFIACLSSHAVSKRGFVQSELNSALKVLETIPEGDVYLIPVRLDNCEVPTKLEHLHWVDYFEQGGAVKLVNAVADYLGHPVSEHLALSPYGPLEFSSISIDQRDSNWGEVRKKEMGHSPFDRPCSQYFHRTKFVYDADPLFDIIVMNITNSPLILTKIGLHVVTICFISYVAGIPKAAKIPKHDSYVLKIPDIMSRLESEGIPLDIEETVEMKLPDPIYLETKAPYRFGLFLKHYSKNLPNWVRIKMWAATDQGESRSAELEAFG